VQSDSFAQWPPAQAPEDLARHTLLRSEDEFWQPWFAGRGLPGRARSRPIFNDSART
jgi:hypothetical protein